MHHRRDGGVKMPLSKHYIVQLQFGCWIASWEGELTYEIENAQRFSSRKHAERSLEKARHFHDFPNAYIDRLIATVI